MVWESFLRILCKGLVYKPNTITNIMLRHVRGICYLELYCDSGTNILVVIEDPTVCARLYAGFVRLLEHEFCTLHFWALVWLCVDSSFLFFPSGASSCIPLTSVMGCSGLGPLFSATVQLLRR